MSVAAALAVVAVVVSGLATAPGASAQTNKANERCFACHSRTDLSTVVNGVPRSLTIGRPVYDHSYHSLLDCTSCHVGFRAQRHTAAETVGWYAQAATTACSDCHAPQAALYRASVHGRVAAQGGTAGLAPSCASCHGSHGIASVGNATFRHDVTARCEACHGARSHTYLDTYHGKAFALGRSGAATCYDCHGAHDILPQSDLRSTVSSRNIVATCARCHPGANRSFASYRVHLSPTSPSSSWLVFTVNSLYILLIAVVFTFGGVHSVLYFWRGRRQGLYDRSHD